MSFYTDADLRDDVDSMLAQLERCERTVQAIRGHLTVVDGAGEISPDRSRGNDWSGYLDEKASTLAGAAHDLRRDITLIATRLEEHRQGVVAHG